MSLRSGELWQQLLYAQSLPSHLLEIAAPSEWSQMCLGGLSHGSPSTQSLNFEDGLLFVDLHVPCSFHFLMMDLTEFLAMFRAFKILLCASPDFYFYLNYLYSELN